MSARRAVLLTLLAVFVIAAVAVSGYLVYKGKQRYDRAVARADARTAQAEAELRSVPLLSCGPLERGQACTWPAEAARRESRAHAQGVQNGEDVGWTQACLALRDVIDFDDCLDRKGR